MRLRKCEKLLTFAAFILLRHDRFVGVSLRGSTSLGNDPISAGWSLRSVPGASKGGLGSSIVLDSSSAAGVSPLQGNAALFKFNSSHKSVSTVAGSTLPASLSPNPLFIYIFFAFVGLLPLYCQDVGLLVFRSMAEHFSCPATFVCPS